jgi:hypothetical protein
MSASVRYQDEGEKVTGGRYNHVEPVVVGYAFQVFK